MIGIVVIGRNEGERLNNCIQSVLSCFPTRSKLIYVDSDSSDNSLAKAKELGIQTLSLDASLPLTAARGRNAGFYHLLQTFPNLEFIQFIDGDCELLPQWLEKAIAEMHQDSKLAIVCGRRRECFPNASIYNRLVDMEWNTPIGETAACGGDSFVRVTAVQSVHGFNDALICGEEPELCIRLRHKGWKIRRIDTDMTLHDASINHFSQWWNRSLRFGWSVAEGQAMHGTPPEHYMLRENKSGWLWGLWVPSLMIALCLPSSGLSFLLGVGYLLLLIRIYRHRQHQGDLPYHAALYAFFCVLSKFPQMIGQLKYQLNDWQGKQATIIEYKMKPLSQSETS
jgi:glycosyltransferase involved in cell wall biosynthesis